MGRERLFSKRVQLCVYVDESDAEFIKQHNINVSELFRIALKQKQLTLLNNNETIE